ncbi:MAG TPA: hypothetical protein VD994_15840, partial [Prosthecobacter sp.]|nr:hypothetical protein [Prosthecobacter sp.]
FLYVRPCRSLIWLGQRDLKNRKGMEFQDAAGKTFTGYGLFAAVSYDEGKTWLERRLITSGGPARETSSIDRVRFVLSDTSAGDRGYLALTQARDGRIHLISSKNRYVFNLSWLEGQASRSLALIARLSRKKLRL